MSIQQSILELESKLRESSKLMINLDQSKLMNSMRSSLNNLDRVYQEYLELNVIDYNPSEITHKETLEYAADMELRKENSGLAYLKEQFKNPPLAELKEKLIDSYKKLGWPEEKIDGELSYIDQAEKKMSRGPKEEIEPIKNFKSNVPHSLTDNEELIGILSELSADMNPAKNLTAAVKLEKFVKEEWGALPDPDNPHFEAMDHYAKEIKQHFAGLNQEQQITM